MKFWDSSAVVPLLVVEQQRDELLGLLQRDPRMLVWWGTLVECTAALARREPARQAPEWYEVKASGQA